MAAPLPDHYATLGVPREATFAEVRAAYRRRSRELHPDRNQSPDANRQMAALNAAYAVLGDGARRAEYDRALPRRHAAPRPAATPPAEGPGAPQPGHMPDWYEFLDLRHGTSTAEILDALRRTRAAILGAGYSEADEERLLAQLRRAAATLTEPRVRAIYDRALEGTPPPPGQYPDYHEHWYSYLGVRPTASLETIAGQVTRLAAGMRRDSPEFRALQLAWRTLRDPEQRLAYDRELIDSRLAAV
jgi:DnaJ-class molecular chaperone